MATIHSAYYYFDLLHLLHALQVLQPNEEVFSREIFAPASLRGGVLRASYIPYIAYMQGEKIPNPVSNTQLYGNFIGFEPLMLRAMAGALECSLEVHNYYDDYIFSSR